MKTADMLTGTQGKIGVASSPRPTVPPILHPSTIPFGDGRSQRRAFCHVQASCINLPGTRQRQPLDSPRMKIPFDTLRPVVTRKRLQLASNESRAHIKHCCRPPQSGEAPKLRHQGRSSKDRSRPDVLFLLVDSPRSVLEGCRLVYATQVRQCATLGWLVDCRSP